MTKTYSAILIDPVSQTIRHATHDGSLEDMLTILSFDGHECGEMESYRIASHKGNKGDDFMCIDANAGHDRRLPDFHLTLASGQVQTIYGRALIVGSTMSGNPSGVKVAISQIMGKLSWGDTQNAFMWKLSAGSNVPANPEPETASPELVSITEEQIVALIARRFGGAV